VWNPDQLDSDGDHVGDACSPATTETDTGAGDTGARNTGTSSTEEDVGWVCASSGPMNVGGLLVMLVMLSLRRRA
jgi:hypothetical protein